MLGGSDGVADGGVTDEQLLRSDDPVALVVGDVVSQAEVSGGIYPTVRAHDGAIL